MRVDREYFNKYTDLYLKLATSGEKITVTENYSKTFELVCDERKVDPHYEISLSYEQFLQIDDENRYEYIDGKLYLLESQTIEHQHVLGILLAEFKTFESHYDYSALIAPLDITLKVNDVYNVVQPDLMLISDIDNCDDDDKYLGVPELVVEILSDNTRVRDISIKATLYEEANVPEYWIVDPKKKRVIVHHFLNDEILIYNSSDKIKSSVISGLEINPYNLFDLPWRNKV